MNEEVIRIKESILGILHKFDVKKAALFGSIVRGEASSNSDIDILIEFDGKKTLFDLVRLKMSLEGVLHRKVDVVTYKSVHPLLKESILGEQEVIL